MDLSTTYMGFELPHPLIPGASPMADDLEVARRLEDAGAPLLIMHSLFEEQIVEDELSYFRAREQGSESFPEARSFIPESADFTLGPDEYLNHIRRLKKTVSVPIIASLN